MNYFRMKTLLSTVLFLIIYTIFAQAISIHAQNCIQPAPNIISWWKGEGDALDVRSRTNGTLRNGTAFVAGYNGRAFSFDGADDVIALGNPASLAPSFRTNGGPIPRSLTIETWIKKDGVPAGGIEDIFAKWGFSGNLDSYLFGVIDDGGTVRAFCATGDGATGDPGLSGGTIPLNTWTHVAMTYNFSDSVNKLYVNGAEVASRVRTGGIFATGVNAFMGNEDSPAARYFKGLIDEPTFYNRALSAAEIQAIYNAGASGKCKPPGLFSQKDKFTYNPFGIIRQAGYSVAISGNTAVLGAPTSSVSPGDQAGQALVFERRNGTWEYAATLVSGEALNFDFFGSSVAISSDKTIVVGTPGRDSPASDSGAAYVFTYSGGNWNTRQKITASDGAANVEFGSSVAISGNTIVVGAPKADLAGGVSDAGAVYIFNRSGGVWTQSQKFIPTGTALAGDRLGASVAISGDTIVSGATHDDEKFENSGTVYVYARSGGTWTQQQKLYGSTIAENGALGTSVAVDGNSIVAGLPALGGQLSGRAFLFVNNGGTWSEQRTLSPAYGVDGDLFGSSVAVKGGTIAVGSPLNDSSAGQDGGSVYIYRRAPANSTEKQQLNPTDGTPGNYFGASVALSEDETLIVGSPHINFDAGLVYSFNQPAKSPFDFDGDGKTDISIFRPSAGQWWYYRSSDGGNYAATFGTSTDKLVPGDFTGDSRVDIAIFRPSSGEWFILRSEDGTYYSFPFGTVGDIPTVGDFDADGKADHAVFRPVDTTWYIRRSSDSGFTIQQFGASGDVPAVADYDGDGKSDIAIYRPSNGQWWLNRSTTGVIVFTFGNSADKLVQGDYTGDGKADVAIFRPSSGEWFILRSEDQSYYSYPFGTNGDIPAPGDYDGDGRFDATVFRPSGSTWFVQRSTAGTLIQSFGIAGDKPVPNAFVP